MAYIKVSSSKNVGAVMRYCEHEKTENRTKGEPIRQREGLVVGGVDCNTKTALQDFKATRLCWNKDKGVQAHLVIQSFEGQEVSPEKANKLGQELAKKYAPGHQAIVYTHNDNGNVHNHIIINAVRLADGHKFESSGNLKKARQLSDEIARENGLSIIKEPARVRYNQAELGLAEKGKQSWKEELREVVEFAKKNSTNLKEFKQNLAESGVKFNERNTKNGTTWTYQHSNGKKCRAYKLGEDYTKDNVQSELNKNNELGKSMQSRENILKKGFENIKNTLEAEKAKERERTSIASGYTMNDLEKEEISAMALRGNDYTAQMARAKLERRAVLSRV